MNLISPIIYIETERLILREITLEDTDAMFELDSNVEVNRYLGNKPVESIEQIKEVIAFIRKQYVDNGIGRFAVIEKATNKFIGWSGLKYFTNTINGHVNFYELGYRFIPTYWGKGYATEASKAWIIHGFQTMDLKEIYAYADANNLASRQVLEKSGLVFIEEFNDDGTKSAWYKIEGF